MKVVIVFPLNSFLTEAGRHCFYDFAGCIFSPVS